MDNPSASSSFSFSVSQNSEPTPMEIDPRPSSQSTTTLDDDDDEESDNSDSASENEAEMGDQESKSYIRQKKMGDSFQIFYINTTRLDEAIKKKGTKKDETSSTPRMDNQRRIQFMIDSYNLARQPQGQGQDRRRGRGQSQETSTAIPIYEEVKKYYGEITMKEPFTFVMYTKREVFIDQETRQKYQGLSKVRFLHREKKTGLTEETPEIFALTSEYGRWVVLEWADSNFPLSIASLVLEEKSVDKKTIKCLFDNRFLSSYLMKEGEKLNQSDGVSLRYCPKICTSFRAQCRSDSEIVQILKKTRNPNQNNRGQLKMNVTAKSISFGCSIKTMDMYIKLCQLLSKFYLNEEDLPLRSTEFYSYFIQPATELKERLNQALKQEIDKIVKPIKNINELFAESKLKDFLICPKDSEGYFNASGYRLIGPSKSVQYRTTIRNSTVLNFFAEAYQNRPKSRKSSQGKFSNYMEKVKISYKNGSKWSPGCKFMSCLEGIFYDEITKADVWRVQGDWYQVSSYYSLDVHTHFVQCLKEHLIVQKDSSLNILWPKKNFPPDKFLPKLIKEDPLLLEALYNKKYENVPNFMLADDKFVYHGIEMCDLLQFFPESLDKSSSSFFLYHVKKYFKAESIRIVVGQIIDAASMLQNALASDDPLSPLQKIYHWANGPKAPWDNFIRRRFSSNYESFKWEMKNATFVCAIAHSSSNISLELEQNMKHRFDFSDVKDAIRRTANNNKKLSKHFHFDRDVQNVRMEITNWLKDSGFIDQDNKFTSTWFAACDDGKNDERQEEFVKRIWDSCPGVHKIGVSDVKLRVLLRENYDTKFKSVPAKQQILHAAEAVKAMGFNFKICEIMPEEIEEAQ